MSSALPADQLSLAERLALDPVARAEFLASLSEDEKKALEYQWSFWARPKQRTPTWHWSFWLILAGRGYGKTRVGSEWVIDKARRGSRGMRIALVAETAADARDVMVEGDSGILAVSPPWFRPAYYPSKRRLVWPNGVIATTYSAEEPDQLRGPQHHYAWGDEPAKWRYADAWDQLQMGLRLGDHPQAVLTTTPRPTPLIKSWVEDATGPNPTFALTRGSTYENRANLAPTFLDTILKKYEGTRLGRQELNAEVLDDAPGALWNRAEHIDAHRVIKPPCDLVRVVVAIDPSVSSDSPGACTGIVVAGLGKDGHGYVLADGSIVQPTPEQWGTAAVTLFHQHRADRIIGEVNNGGDLVESNVRSIEQLPFKKVSASRGKQKRAEPIASFYEQGRVHHVGSLPLLEDEMCLVAGTLITLRRGQVPIEQVRPGDEALTRKGWRAVTWAGQTGVSLTRRLKTSAGVELEGTDSHPIWTEEDGFVPLAQATRSHTLLACRRPSFDPSSSSTACATFSTRTGTTSRVARAVAACITEKFGKLRTALSLPAGTCITSITTAATTLWRTSKPCRRPSTSENTGAQARGLGASIGRAARRSANGQLKPRESEAANTAAANTFRPGCAPCTAVRVVENEPTLRPPEPVFNLTVEGEHEYFANGLLVHNCQWEPGVSPWSPNRLDALVWALTELMLGPKPRRRGSLSVVNTSDRD